MFMNYVLISSSMHSNLPASWVEAAGARRGGGGREACSRDEEEKGSGKNDRQG